jgi:hypothetical protein
MNRYAGSARQIELAATTFRTTACGWRTLGIGASLRSAVSYRIELKQRVN